MLTRVSSERTGYATPVSEFILQMEKLKHCVHLILELPYNLSFELGYFWHTLGENINKKL